MRDNLDRDLVLIGGGHSHAIALRLLAINPLPGVRLTLISETTHTPYSGMLPGHVAGFYNFDETHIDLRRLCRFAGVQFYQDRAMGLNLEKNQIICAKHPSVTFNLLSIDIGSTPAKISVSGAEDYAIAAKPVPQFLTAWSKLLEEVERTSSKALNLAIVGGGAGGVELALTMQQRLRKVLGQDTIKIHLFHRGRELMNSHNLWVRRCLEKILKQRGIQVHLQETVCEVKPNLVRCESGFAVKCDRIFWVTQASAPSWLARSGLTTDSQGFILVEDTLQSVSHPQIFAAGDIATMKNYWRPKAGVFAVRQGRPLFENLKRIVLGKPLKLYRPQKDILGLIGTGDGKAIASRGNWGLGPSKLLWSWKDYIDRQFMRQFSELPEMGSQTEEGNSNIRNKTDQTSSIMRCGGCGSKVGSPILERVLGRIKADNYNWEESQDVIIGLDSPDDAAAVRVPAGLLMVHTIDYFRSLINDPFVFGQICANHCLSDLFAMGATPHTALAIASIPYATDSKVEETLYQLLSGAIKILSQSQTSLVGGHTTEGAELALGLSCNGLVSPDKLLPKGGMKPGQVLILTKALGTGILFAADMRLKAKGRWVDGAVESMLSSNQQASEIFLQHGATACTDITGFGLVGHLREMVQASRVAVELNLEAIPVLEGVREMLELGIVSSLHSQNLYGSRYIRNWEERRLHPLYSILFDPQTSGGLLASVPEAEADRCVASLQQLGYARARVIGSVAQSTDLTRPITIIR